MSTSEVGSGVLSGGKLPARRLRGDADRGSSSGRDIFRFLIVEDVVKGSCLCSSGAATRKRRLQGIDLGRAHGIKPGRSCCDVNSPQVAVENAKCRVSCR